MSNFKKEPPDKYTIIKTSFKNIQKYNVDYKPLLDAFYRSNETYIHVSYFFLLYQIYSFEKDENMIEVNATNLNLALIALKNESLGANSSFENKIVIDKFKDFYNDTYKNLVDNKKLKCKNLGSINDFSLKQIETTFYTNIKRNFISNINGFVNRMFNISNNIILDKLTGTEKSNMKETLKSEQREVKSDLLNGTLNSNEKYHEWIEEYRLQILPKLEKEMLYEKDVMENPWKYFRYMIKMNKILEKNNLKLNTVFPLRTELYSKYIQLDTKSLIELFIDKNLNDYYSKITERKDEIWRKFFNLENKVFQKNKYKFDYTILTDGKAVSIRFINEKYLEKNDEKKEKMREARKKAINNKSNIRKSNEEEYKNLLTELEAEIIKRKMAEMEKEENLEPKKKDEIRNKYKKIMKDEIAKLKENLAIKIIEQLQKHTNAKKEIESKTKEEIKKRNKEKQKIQKEMYKQKTKDEKKEWVKEKQKKTAEFMYIDELEKEEIERIKTKNRIYIDPGKRSLLMIIDNEERILNYTNKERMKKTKRLKYQRLNANYREKSGITEIEKELVGYNSKTCELENLKKYIKKKNEINEKLKDTNFDYLKKLKWYSYINNQKADAEIINKIKNKYGKEIVVIIGDWSIGKQMRNFKPTPNLRLKRLLAKEFEMYNIDEYRTSCLHYKTEEKVRNLYIKDKKGEIHKLHSVLTYETEQKSKGCINRDKNGVKNIRKLGEEYIKTGERPEKYRREKKIIIVKAAEYEQAQKVQLQGKVKNKRNKKSETPKKLKQKNGNETKVNSKVTIDIKNKKNKAKNKSKNLKSIEGKVSHTSIKSL